MSSTDVESESPQLSKNQRLRQMLAGEQIIRSFAPHDVFTARILEDAGIELLFLGGFGVSASVLGVPDVGLTTLTEMTEAVRRMADRLTVPLIADGDTGHGDLHNVARTVRDFERAGASGMLLEDQVAPKRCGHFSGKQVIPADEMLDKLKTALDTRSDPDFVIIARTDARAVEGLDAAIERANRYGEAGADVCFVEAPQSIDELSQVARDVPFPQLANMLPGGVTPILPADKLQQLGFRIVVDPVGTLLATGFVIKQLAEAMLNDGRVDQLSSQMLGFDEVKQLLGLDEISSLKRL
ncbi:MAG: oxaloacetate decarboxylase [Planctomycetota bacterium]|nr:oxaloacetate decarboxylase [Planctomycetota bacterium]MDA0920554.1 oxaloacetate decarboxylase [Planctomycetota bacterium]MDA1159296.1 oxaloacetate decarboxylase [Planctomycetota bacterium]